MMMNKLRNILFLMMVMTAMLVLVNSVAANGGMVIRWRVIGGGGGASSGGQYSISSSIGQPIVANASGVHDQLCAGYWCGAPSGYRLYLPTIQK